MFSPLFFWSIMHPLFLLWHSKCHCLPHFILILTFLLILSIWLNFALEKQIDWIKPHRSLCFWEAIYVPLGCLFIHFLSKKHWCKEVFLKSHQLASLCKTKLWDKRENFPWKGKHFFFPSFSCSNHFLGFEPWLSQSFKSSSEDYWGYSLQTPNLDTVSQGKRVSENVTSSENSKILFVMWKLNRGSDSDLVWVDLIKSHLIFLNIGFLITQRHNKVYFKGWLQELNPKFSYNVKVQKRLLTLYKQYYIKSSQQSMWWVLFLTTTLQLRKQRFSNISKVI